MTAAIARVAGAARTSVAGSTTPETSRVDHTRTLRTVTSETSVTTAAPVMPAIGITTRFKATLTRAPPNAAARYRRSPPRARRRKANPALAYTVRTLQMRILNGRTARANASP